MLAVDLPGHGRSPTLPGLPTIDDFAAVLIRDLSQQLAGPAHFVGLSLGGLVALQCAIAHPRWVRSLTIVNAFARMQVPARGLGRMFGRLVLLAFAPMSWVGRWVAGGLFRDEGQAQLRELAAARLAANPRRAYFSAALAVARFDARAALDDSPLPDAGYRRRAGSDGRLSSQAAAGTGHRGGTLPGDTGFRTCHAGGRTQRLQRGADQIPRFGGKVCEVTAA